jgi:predicted permease
MSDWKRYVRRRLPPLDLRPEREQEIVEELAEHLENAYQEALARGDSEAVAYEKATAMVVDWRLLECEIAGVERGNASEWLDRVIDDEGQSKRKIGGGGFMRSVLQDLRYGLRMMARSPGFTAAAVLSLALGIGANTALFSLVDAMLLRMLPVREPERLALLRWYSGPNRPARLVDGEHDNDKAKGIETGTSFSYFSFDRLRANNQTLEDIFAFTSIGQVNLVVDGQAEVASGQLVSGDYYNGLGVRPVLGRAIVEADDLATAAPVAVISHRYWDRRFGLDPAVVGRTIRVNNTAVTIIGVAPADFHGTLQIGSNPDLTFALAMEPQVVMGSSAEPWLAKPWYWWIQIIGRLKPGVSVEQAQANLDVIYQQAALDTWQAMPADWRSSTAPQSQLLRLDPGGQGLGSSRKEYAQPLRILFVIVGLILLIASINVAGLLLARAASRRKEMALRLAVGAGRFRLIRQLLTESLLIAFLGGGLGVLLAYWGKDALVALRPWGGGSLTLDLKFDLRVLGFTAAITILTGILFGLAPALRVTRVELNDALKNNADAGSRGRLTLGKSLIVLQAALSLVLLVGAGLFVRTLQNLHNVNLGFNAENLLVFRADPRVSGHKGEQVSEIYRRMVERIDALPGVVRASFSRHSPLSGGGGTSTVSVPGRTPNDIQVDNVAEILIGPEYFEAMETPLLRGRSLGAQDHAKTPKVAVVNQVFSQRFLADRDPIGAHFFFGRGGPNEAPDPKSFIEIVGLVRDAKYSTQRQDVRPTMFLPAAQSPRGQGEMSFSVRTVGDPVAMVPTIREAIRQLDPNLPLYGFTTVMEQAAQRLSQERLFARLTSFFGLLALLLASIGLYGVMAHSVGRRTKEIGIRMVLGAERARVVKMVFRESMLLILIGVLIGVGAAIASVHFVSSLLYGLTPNDPLTIVAVALIMLIVAALASYLPARRAAEVDPMIALRVE